MSGRVTPKAKESSLFGIRIGGTDVRSITALSDVLKESDSYDLVVLRVDAADVVLIHELEAAGGRLCDTLINYRRTQRSEDSVDEESSDVRIRVADPSDLQSLEVLARDSFRHAPTHWHTDPKLNSDLAAELYARWAVDLLVGQSETRVLIATDRAGKPAGFLGVSPVSDIHGFVPLAGVSPAFRGVGLLSRLIRQTSSVVGSLKTLDYETQVTNWAASRVVSRLGFLPVSARSTFHLWADR